MKPSRNISLPFLLFAGILAASLPTSVWMMSLSQFLLAGVFVAGGISLHQYKAFYRNNNLLVVLAGFIPYHLYLAGKGFIRQVKNLENKPLLAIFMLFYLVHVAGAFYSDNMPSTLAALRIKLPVLLIPLFFAAIRGITPLQKHRLLLVFVMSTFVVSLISLTLFLTGRYTDLREISPFIHHIQFSVLVAWSIIILLYAGGKRLWKVPGEHLWAPLTALWLAFFLLVILKTLSGIIVLIAGLYFVLLRRDALATGMPAWLQRATLILLPLLVAGYLGYAIHRFYDVQEVDPATLAQTTSRDNPYHHWPEISTIENGHYVFYFIAEEELREAWNQRSSLPYDSLDLRGQHLKHTLFRYLTSLGLRKDAEAVNQLTDQQVAHIEQGLANHLYTQRYSLYPRVYQVIWEVDNYLNTANPSGHSFTQRLESVRIGMGIAARNLLFGVGTGDLSNHYHAVYDQKGVQQEAHHRITGANQWLNFIVAFGLAGFMIIIVALVYPAARAGAFSNPLFATFFLISVVAMFGEDMLKFQAGITFFVFFYSYFVFLKAENPQS